jgi:hypothetical protein
MKKKNVKSGHLVLVLSIDWGTCDVKYLSHFLQNVPEHHRVGTTVANAEGGPYLADLPNYVIVIQHNFPQFHRSYLEINLFYHNVNDILTTYPYYTIS